MQKKIRKFSVSKLGNDETQNQDVVDFDQAHGIFCISDGATVGSYQREWALLLVQSFIKNPFKKNQKDVDLLTWIGPIQKQWYENLPWAILNDKADSVVEKAQEGAGATFLGFTLFGKNNSRLSAWAIGDSTLFIIRNDELIKSFPMERSTDFGNVPKLIFSMSRKDIQTDGSFNFVCSNGYLSSLLDFELKQGDLIIATTDALAKWFFSEYEIGNLPWNELQQVQDEDFKSFIKLKIESNEMINDDATVLLLEF